MKKIILIISIVIVLIALLSLGYLKWFLPNIAAAPDLKVELTPERIANGEYLANHVTVCMDCHSTRDWSRYSGPLVNGTLGKGGEYFDQKMGFPGIFYSKNITPFHLKSWTDGEIFRAITTGVNKEGQTIFPVMPYAYYAQMDKEDIYDIIAYLRSLPAIVNTVPSSKADFPVNLLLNTIPKEASFSQKPPKSDTLAYGKYLTTIAGCMECHTPTDNRANILMDKTFTGGRIFELPQGTLRSSNLTPDKETGIGEWTDSVFLNFFKANATRSLQKVTTNGFNTLMPWSMYAGMTNDDLRAIFIYLKSLPPVKNSVVIFPERTEKESIK